MTLSSERRILHVLSKNFKVDDRSGIEEPEGLTGSRLAANVHLVTSSRTTENDFKTCFEELDIDIEIYLPGKQIEKKSIPKDKTLDNF